MNEMLALLTSVSICEEKLEAELLLKAHGKQGLSAAAKLLPAASDKGKNRLLICETAEHAQCNRGV